MTDTLLTFKMHPDGDWRLVHQEWPSTAVISHAVVMACHPMMRLRDGFVDIRLPGGRGRAVYRIDDEALGMYSVTCAYAELWP